MQVIGFNFEKIQAERKSHGKGGKIEINSNINIKEIIEDTIDVVKEKPVLKVNFEFSMPSSNF